LKLLKSAFYIMQTSNVLHHGPLATKLLKFYVRLAARSAARAFDSSYTGSRVRIPLKAWMFVLVFLYCIVLCRYRPCDELITRPRSPTVCRNRLRNQKIIEGEGPKLDYRSQWRWCKIGVIMTQYETTLNPPDNFTNWFQRWNVRTYRRTHHNEDCQLAKTYAPLWRTWLS
jgi:hypothetical protein